MRKREDISTLEPTRYEVALFINGRIERVLGYTARKSRHGLDRYWDQAIDLVHGLIKSDRLPASVAEGRMRFSSAKGWDNGSLRLAFTGETERSAAMIAAVQGSEA